MFVPRLGTEISMKLKANVMSVVEPVKACGCRRCSSKIEFKSTKTDTNVFIILCDLYAQLGQT